MNGLCARLHNKIHTVKCIGSKAIDTSLTIMQFAPVILLVYAHVLTRAVVNKDLT